MAGREEGRWVGSRTGQQDTGRQRTWEWGTGVHTPIMTRPPEGARHRNPGAYPELQALSRGRVHVTSSDSREMPADHRDTVTLQGPPFAGLLQPGVSLAAPRAVTRIPLTPSRAVTRTGPFLPGRALPRPTPTPCSPLQGQSPPLALGSS